MDNKTLTPEQIKNWRQIIFMQLEQQFPGAGSYAIIMPDSEVITFWKKMKNLLESEPTKTIMETKPLTRSEIHYYKPKKCNHENSITGQNGTYCLDCESYVD